MRCFALLLLIAGCSHDQNQKTVENFLSKEYGNDPVTIVKRFKPVRSDDALKNIILEDIEVAEKRLPILKATVDVASETIEIVRADINRPSGISDLEEAHRRRSESKRAVQAVEHEIEILKNALNAAPFIGVRLRYRALSKHGENTLYDDLFVIRDTKISEVIEISENSRSPLSKWAIRYFQD